MIISKSRARSLRLKMCRPPPSYTTYMNVNDGTGSLWAATQADEPLNVQNGMELTINGFLMTNFRSNSTGKTYDLIMFTRPDEITEAAVSGKYKVQSVDLEVYKDNSRIGSGTAEYLDSQTGSGTFLSWIPALQEQIFM